MKIVSFDDTPRAIQMIAYYTGLVSIVACAAHAILGHGYGVGMYLDWAADARRDRVVTISKAFNDKLSTTDEADGAIYVVKGKKNATLAKYAVFSSTAPTSGDYYVLQS